MKVISTNISEKRIVTIGGEEVVTGMYKFPVASGIFLGKDGVQSDAVIDRRYHGGSDKACYIFGKNNYAHFEPLYPDVTWEFGMFGENLTIDVLDESKLNIGDVYEIGETQIQISEARIPCSKLGHRLGNPSAVKEFAKAPYPGAYVRVLKEGKVKVGDELILLKAQSEKLILTDLYNMMKSKSEYKHLFKEVLKNPFITDNVRTKFTM